MPIVKQWDLVLLTCIGLASLAVAHAEEGKEDGPMQTIFYIIAAVFTVLVVGACICCCCICGTCLYGFQMPEERQQTVIAKLQEWESKGYLPKLNDDHAAAKPADPPKDTTLGNSQEQGDRPTAAAPVVDANATSQTPAGAAATNSNSKAEESPSKGKADFLREARRLVNESDTRPAEPKLARTLKAEEQV
mmetsp:Transcript_65247/g.121642  ORF Transcript_65247/g.121642 Transcript_65247/m.121642 type:complete len:191 (-) Transcript_65247:22-594(-)